MLRKAFTSILGLMLMVVGLVAWVLPFVPGAPLFLFGLGLTIGWHPYGKKVIDKFNERLKKILTTWNLNFRKDQDIERELFKPEKEKLTLKTNSLLKK